MKITIMAEGPVASGKSLSIADMINGLRDYGHFVIETRIGEREVDKDRLVEIEVLTVRLREQYPIEHDQ